MTRHEGHYFRSSSSLSIQELTTTFLLALRGMTAHAAYASFQEDKVGRIAKGLRADVTVLSRDIMTVRADEILGAVVAATIIDGRVVYGGLKL
jgi:predicted amidohydrolase YtcJ